MKDVSQPRWLLYYSKEADKKLPEHTDGYIIPDSSSDIAEVAIRQPRESFQVTRIVNFGMKLLVSLQLL